MSCMSVLISGHPGTSGSCPWPSHPTCSVAKVEPVPNQGEAFYAQLFDQAIRRGMKWVSLISRAPSGYYKKRNQH